MARNKKSANRVRNYVVMCSLFGVLLIVGTYAWFIGMESVAVNQFDVTIAAAEGLALSLDGKHTNFTESVSINASDYKTKSYDGNQNVWGELIPMSSVGVINNTTSKLELYEKGSLTATKGGYRILASKVQNTAEKE